MAQPSEKLAAITKTTKVARRFVPESEVERVVDEVSERIRTQSNAMLAEQAAAAHLLKYKAKKSRRLAAHLKIQNEKLQQAVEEEQLKFKKLKEALKRRTEQYDKLRVAHADIEDKVARQTKKLSKMRERLAAAELKLENNATQQPSHPQRFMSLPTPAQLQDMHQIDVVTQGQFDSMPPPPSASIRRAKERPRATTPQYNKRPQRLQGAYAFRPASAPEGDRQEDGERPAFVMDSRPGTSDSFATQQHSGTDESEDEGHIQQSFGTTRFAEGEVDGEASKELGDSSGHEFTDEEMGHAHLAGRAGETGEEYDDFPAEGIADHVDFPPRPMSGHVSVDREGDFGPTTTRNHPASMRPASSPLSRKGAPPLHGGPSTGASLLTPGPWAPSRPEDFDASANVHPEDRPATAPDEVYRQMSGAAGDGSAFDASDHLDQQDDITLEERENADIDQFLDEGDRLAGRPNSAPAGSSPKRKKKSFPKRMPKKRDNAAHALEEERRRKEQQEADEQMRMQGLKKTWLRAIHDEPSESGIDKYAYQKKSKWLCLAVCQGIICTHSAPRRHICFGLTITMLLFCGTLRSYASNKAFGYYVAAADFAICLMGFMSYTGMYYVVSAGNVLRRMLTYAFHENRHRGELQDMDRKWRYFVAPGTQLIGGLASVGYVALTVVKSMSVLDELSVLMMVIGSPAIVWFSVLISHFIGVFLFVQFSALMFIRENSPMLKRQDPAVENFFRIRRLVEMLTESFGKHLVVPVGLVSLIGVLLCSFGIARSEAGVLPIELVILGFFFTLLLWTLLKTAGGITKAVDEMFKERTMHTLELLKGFEASYSMKLMEMSGNAATNDLLVNISNKTLKYHNMMFSLFVTGGDGRDPKLSFALYGISIRPIHSFGAFAFCITCLTCAMGFPGFVGGAGVLTQTTEATGL